MGSKGFSSNVMRDSAGFQGKADGEFVVDELVSEFCRVEEGLAAEADVKVRTVEYHFTRNGRFGFAHLHLHGEGYVCCASLDGDGAIGCEVHSVRSTQRIQAHEFKLSGGELLHAKEIIAHEVAVQAFLAAAFQVGGVDARHVNDDGSTFDHAIVNVDVAIADLDVAVVASGHFLAFPGDGALFGVNVLLCGHCAIIGGAKKRGKRHGCRENEGIHGMGRVMVFGPCYAFASLWNKLFGITFNSEGTNLPNKSMVSFNAMKLKYAK